MRKRRANPGGVATAAIVVGSLYVGGVVAIALVTRSLSTAILAWPYYGATRAPASSSSSPQVRA